MIRHDDAAGTTTTTTTTTRGSRKLKLRKHHDHDHDEVEEVAMAMAMAMDLDASPPRSASPILRRRQRPTTTTRIPPFPNHTLSSSSTTSTTTNTAAFQYHQQQQHSSSMAILPTSHVLSPICLNSATTTTTTTTHCSSPGDPLKGKSAPPPPTHHSTPPKHRYPAGDYKYHPADEQKTAGLMSSSPAIESPLISMSVDEEEEEARSKKEGAEEIMVWTNAVFQANSCEETSSNYTTTSIDDMNLRYLPLLTAKSCTVVKPQSVQNEETVDESNARLRRGCAEHKALLNNPTANAASGDELEEIELQIKQLTDQLKKLQAQKEQVVAKRRNVFKQRSRLAMGVGGYGLRSAKSGCVAASQNSFATTRLSNGVPTFKGLRSSQPMKKKQYIPNSSKANNALNVVIKGEDGLIRGKRPVSSTRSGCSTTLAARIGGNGAKPSHGLNATTRATAAGGGGGGGVSVRNRGTVTMSCQMLNMNVMRSGVAKNNMNIRRMPPPKEAVATAAPSLGPSLSSRRNSSVAKSLMSFMNAGGGGAVVVGENLETRKGAENGTLRAGGRIAPPLPLPPPPAPMINVTTAAPKTTADLHERLESLLRESQVFFGLRRSRTAPSTPQAKTKVHNSLCIESNMAEPMEGNNSFIAGAPPPYIPTATMPVHLSSNSSSPSAFDHDDLMRRLHAIAASHHETSTEPTSRSHNEDSKPALPSLTMDAATNKNLLRSMSTDHCKSNDGLLSEEMSSLRALQMNQIASPGPRSRMRWHQRP